MKHTNVQEATSTPKVEEIVYGIEERESFYKKLFSNKGAVFGSIVIVLFILTAIFAPYIAPYKYDLMNMPNMLQSPNAQNLLGTDEFGRDILSRIIYGSQISLVVGFIAVMISAVIGIVL
jgi:peptide/nickel transport system permease protein